MAEKSMNYQKYLPLNQPSLTLIICVFFGLVWFLVPHPLLIIALCIIPLGFLVSLGFTFIFVLLFVLFSFFRLHEVFPVLYPLKITLMLSAAVLLSLFWHLGISKQVAIYLNRELVIGVVFFILVFLGIIFSSNRPIAIEYTKNVYWKIAVMMFTIAWFTRRAQDFDLSSRLITFAGTLVGLVAISNKLSGIGLVEETRVTIGRHLGSVLGDPNDLALVLMFPSAFALSLLLTQGTGKLSRTLACIGVPILFFAIIATQSRGGLLGMLAIFAVFALKKIRSKVLLISLMSFLAIALFIFAGVSGRKSGGASEAGIDASAQGRLYAWEAAFGMAVDNPLTGVGIDNFYSNYYYYSKHWDGLNHAVHSTWFGVLAETGFLGFSIFVLFVIALFKSSYHSMKQIERHASQIEQASAASMIACSQACYAGLVGTIVSGTFLTHGFTWPIYILAGLISALSNWTQKQNLE